MHLPSLNFGGSWNKTLYGPKGDAGSVSIAKGANASFKLPSFGFDFNLDHNGAINFKSGDGDKWRLNLAPAVSIGDADLVRADHFALLRGPDGEIGFSFDAKIGCRLFFNFAKNLGRPNFTLKMNVSITSALQQQSISKH